MKKENFEWCKSISETIDKYVHGEMYTCPECNNDIEWNNDNYNDNDNTYTCPHCGETFNADNLEALTIYDYFNDIYNTEWRLDANREYKSVAFMVACGGPNIWIDTGSKQVELYWWSDSASYPLSYDAVNEIDNFAEELYHC